MLATLAVACLAVLFSIIAADEVRRLGRHVAALEDRLDRLDPPNPRHRLTERP